MADIRPEDCQRFAIYYTPPQGAWADWCAAWLGWDAVAGQARPHPSVDGLPRPVAQLTDTPRKYGFHATLKPPMRLRDRVAFDDLRSALVQLAAAQQPVQLDGLSVTGLGRFAALTPIGDVQRLNALAGDLVRALDGFRAPLRPEDLERRRASGLTAAQDALLLAWGYPYVFDEFRFHMTLTGRLAPNELSSVVPILQSALAPILPAPVLVDAVTLAGEAADGQFYALDRVALTG